MNAVLVQQGRMCSRLIRALRKSRSSTWEPQRRDLLSSLTAEGRCPPVMSRPGFTRGLPAPRSVRNTRMASLVIWPCSWKTQLKFKAQSRSLLFWRIRRSFSRCSWGSRGKNTGVASHVLQQERTNMVCHVPCSTAFCSSSSISCL